MQNLHRVTRTSLNSRIFCADSLHTRVKSKNFDELPSVCPRRQKSRTIKIFFPHLNKPDAKLKLAPQPFGGLNIVVPLLYGSNDAEPALITWAISYHGNRAFLSSEQLS